jgi:phage terminase large subunit GpA-like protein
MACSHDGYHGISTAYDRANGLLRYYWTCEQCGTKLREARSEEYRPSFDPHGNDRFVPYPAT